MRVNAARHILAAALILAAPTVAMAAKPAKVPAPRYYAQVQDFSLSTVDPTPPFIGITVNNFLAETKEVGTVAGAVSATEFALAGNSARHGGASFAHAQGADNVTFGRASILNLFKISGPDLAAGAVVPTEIDAHLEFEVTGAGRAYDTFVLGDYAGEGPVLSGDINSVWNPDPGLQVIDIHSIFGFRPNVLYYFVTAVSVGVNDDAFGALFDPNLDGTPHPGTASALVDPQIVIDPEFADRYHIVGGLLGSPDTGDGVPEPAAWALMLVGFGGLGAALRARRSATLGNPHTRKETC